MQPEQKRGKQNRNQRSLIIVEWVLFILHWRCDYRGGRVWIAKHVALVKFACQILIIIILSHRDVIWTQIMVSFVNVVKSPKHRNKFFTYTNVESVTWRFFPYHFSSKDLRWGRDSTRLIWTCTVVKTAKKELNSMSPVAFLWCFSIHCDLDSWEPSQA